MGLLAAAVGLLMREYRFEEAKNLLNEIRLPDATLQRCWLRLLLIQQ
jgi:hypothetical protein